jgi:hypothetical protein
MKRSIKTITKCIKSERRKLATIRDRLRKLIEELEEYEGVTDSAIADIDHAVDDLSGYL